MKIWIRLATVISALWLLGVASLVAVDFLNLMPGNCIFDTQKSFPLLSFEGWFISCNMFSDLLDTPGSWWGDTVIRRGNQVVELSLYRLFFSTVAPVALIWIVLVALPASLKWIRKDRRGEQ